MLNILTSENKLLRKKSKKIAKVDDSIRTLAKSMIETMYAANGIGLSAVQVGVLKQIIVVDCHGEPIVMINPVITMSNIEIFLVSPILSLMMVWLHESFNMRSCIFMGN